jgi:hypothetical protein
MRVFGMQIVSYEHDALAKGILWTPCRPVPIQPF